MGRKLGKGLIYMHSVGTYKKRLYRFLFAAAITTASILCILTGVFLKRQSASDYRHYVEQTAHSQESSFTVSASIILRAVNECLKSGELIQWADSSSLQEFYFHAISAGKRLRQSTTDILQIEYQFAATPLNPRSFNGTITDMVLTSSGSVNVEKYCSAEQIPEKEYLKIIEYFQDHNQPYLLPHYDSETGQLTAFHYILKDIGKQNPVLLFVSIPIETFISDLLAESFFIFNADRILAFSSVDESVREESVSYYRRLLASEDIAAYSTPQMDNGHYLVVSTISPLQWQIASVYPPKSLHTGTIAVFTLVVFLIIALFLFLSYCMVERLYHPMEELFESSGMAEPAGNTSVDEFQIIRTNMEKITELGNLLHTAVEENNFLMSNQSYKELLFSNNPAAFHPEQFEAPDSDYCVAIGETFSAEDDYAFQVISLQKSIACDMAARRDDLIYINLDYNRYALILQVPSLEGGKSILSSLLRSMESNDSLAESDYRIVLSNVHKGLNQLHLCYQEALRILEFRYFHAKSRLITYEEISSIDAVTYSYPLETENRLIQCALDGREEAITIFENVIRENIRAKDLSKETLQNLIYALIGTLSRIFQELKTTPEELLGKQVDYKYLYNHWNDSAVYLQIKELLEEIIQAINQRDSSRDHELLDKMLGYIYENYWDNIMLTDLADYVNISPKYCGILFKELSDNNFKDFLNRYRIEKSKEILKKNPSVKIVELSAMVGFNSSNSFIRVFNKYVGVSPKAYRERLWEQQNK